MLSVVQGHDSLLGTFSSFQTLLMACVAHYPVRACLARVSCQTGQTERHLLSCDATSIGRKSTGMEEASGWGGSLH